MTRVLLVTIILIGRTGTEVVCCETARGLRRRGHDVIVHTQHDGPTADQLRAEGFPVTTDLASVPFVPDVIQANQTYPLLEAIGHFPSTPAIAICHDATVWYNEPVDLPSVRHVAVDLACRDRIAAGLSRPAEQIEILHNAVDLEAFGPRGPLPPRPRRALVLAKHPSYLEAVRAACAQRDVELDVVGPAVGRVVDDLPARLPAYDLVFASARAALEAMAAGCAVIVVDSRGLAGLVTSDSVAWWRQNNFGRRLLTRPASLELIRAEIDRYDPADAQHVSRFIRQDASLERYLDRLEVLHREVIAHAAANPIDRDELIHRMSRSFRPIEAAWRAQRDREFEDVARSRQEELAGLAERARLREAELTANFEQRLAEQQHALEGEIRRHGRAWEAEVQRQAQYWQAESQRQSQAWEAELQRQSQAWEAQSQLRAQAREAEFQRQTGLMEAEFQRQADLKAAELAAFRARAAPRNLHRRILQRIRRELFGG